MQCVGTLRWSDAGLGVWNGAARRGAEPARPNAHADGRGSDRRACAGQAMAAGVCVNGEARRSEGGRELRPRGLEARPMGQGARAMDGGVRPLEIDWSQTVRRCMDGDSAAWAELVRAHHKRVYGLCYRFTGSSPDAEDLTQDVFLKIYSNLGSFDTTRGSLQVWITTMTRNLLVDNFRRTKNQRATGSLDEGWDQTEELRPVDRLVGREPSPHELAARKELGKMVQEALSHVSVELREAVILRDLQDLDYKEIAQVLQIPEGTVKSRISRGRAELARLLERTKREVM
jgi:RNA polymerase sigma-70 factor (ECF subfamily)